MKQHLNLKKPALCWVMFVVFALLFVSSVSARSSAVNQTLTEFTNMTTADNIAELGQEANAWVGGLIGITIMIVIFLASFVLSMYFTQRIAPTLVMSMFVVTVTAVILRLISLVPDDAIYISFPLFLLAMGYAVATRGGE